MKQKNYKSYFLTYDFISTSIQKGKISLNILCSIEPVIYKLNIKSIRKDRFTFQQSRLCELIGIEFEDKSFQSIEYKDLNQKAIEYIKSYTKHNELLICYELSEQTKEIFNYLGIIYIDIWLSPIRFYDDLMFEFFSNDKNIQTQLKSYALKDKCLFKKAKELIKYSKHFLGKGYVPKKNSALIVGQLFEDKAVLKEKSFLSLLDFYDEIKILSKRYAKVYITKHPLMKEKEFYKIINAFKNIDNIEYLENINTYQLLLSKRIKHVIGISSSVLSEAQYFNKEITYLYKPVINKEYIRIYKKYFTTTFWENILKLKTKKKKVFMTFDNFLRNKYNAKYAYSLFLSQNDDIQIYEEFVKLYELLNDLEQHKKYILYGYGSLGKLIASHIPNLIGIIDKNISVDSIKSTPLINIKDLNLYPEAVILVSPFIYNKEIKEKLCCYNNKIIFIKETK